ncbi:MAG: ATP-dependent helicase [Desulfobulbaceae bacterium]|uniref:DNA 3'-5' helicase n=1 Tax=Candidatus Desulfobia pelagia TaxID=2841692 RepID=A0A8J6NFF4_9BACT|nr:ATP-dependent helicase [Candidatus Desulfobia pelagia]MBL6995081.1 ATP-dependent helicase [Desulfobacula sp.]
MIELNKQQKEAAEFMFGVSCVIATVGSGKTTTMTYRIGNLVRNGIPPESILGLTFTRNAAKAMREKLKLVLNDDASKVTLSTIHSFCHRLLKREDIRFDILYGNKQVWLIRKVISKLRIKDILTPVALREISLAKSRLITPDKFLELHKDSDFMVSLAEIYKGYEQEKRKGLLLDFDDLLMESHDILTRSEDARIRYQQTYPHILVDEFQDTNPAQVSLIKLLAGDPDQSNSLWICGDDWQSIYSFIGASVENILHFANDHEGSTQFILDLNYRSTNQILQACQNLISHNDRKIDKTLNTINPDGDTVIVFSATTEEKEAAKVVTEIKDLVHRHDYKYRDIAILYRANSQSRAIEEELSKNEIPFWIENSSNFYERYEVAGLLNYLWLIHDANSDRGDTALKKVINTPNRYIGGRFIGDLEAYAKSNGLNLYEALKFMPVDVPYLRKNIRQFTDFIDQLIIDKWDWEPVDLIYLIRTELDYDKYIADESAELYDDSSNIIDQLQIAAGRFSELHKFLEFTETVRNSSGGDKEGVSLMTIHKSKGLEFPAVFVIGMIEGILPNIKGEIEEERRVSFVALSRAMKLLYLSYSHIHMGRPAQKSSFLDEILKKKEVVTE